MCCLEEPIIGKIWHFRIHALSKKNKSQESNQHSILSLIPILLVTVSLASMGTITDFQHLWIFNETTVMEPL